MARTRLEDDYEAYREARNRKGRHIRKILRNTHRHRVKEASASESGLWKLAKWAQNRHTVAFASTPALIKPDRELACQPEEKAETLRQSFFPLPLPADLSDIDEYEYPQSIKSPEIRRQRSRKQYAELPQTKHQARTTSQTASYNSSRHPPRTPLQNLQHVPPARILSHTLQGDCYSCPPEARKG